MKWAVWQLGKIGVGTVLWLAAAAAYPADAVEPARAETAPRSEPVAKPHHFQLQNRADVPQRDGHLSPQDRKLLRQHIEDAARDMYKH